MGKDSATAGAVPLPPGPTPGPWHVHDGRNPDHLIQRLQIGGKDKIITQIYCTSSDDPADLANARLIAAAPDLLEALEQLRAFIGVTYGEGPEAHILESVPTRVGIPVKLGAIMRRVSAAIAKAGG